MHDRIVIDKKLAFMSGVSYGAVKKDLNWGTKSVREREKSTEFL